MKVLRSVVVILAVIFVFYNASACAGLEKFTDKAGRVWTLGFGKSILEPGDLIDNTYYIAGYRPDNRATGLLDLQYARAVWLDDNTGRGGMVFVAVDCVGLSRTDVLNVRNMLYGFIKETGCRGVHIMSTHTHAGIDTLGLWGPIGSTGRNGAFMSTVFDGICRAVRSAYENRREGELFYGSSEVDEIQRDSRYPEVFDKRLSRFRFVPSDGSGELYMVHFSAHPEALRSENSLVSSDFPCYMGERITERTGAEFIYFTGAIGGLIATKRYDSEEGISVVESTVKTGRLLGDIACDIKEERLLIPRLNSVTEEISIPLENPVHMLASFLGLITTRAYSNLNSKYFINVRTEISYMKIDDIELILVPGELFPELAYGGFLESGDNPANPDAKNPPTFTQLLNNDDFLVFGLANDEIGYIVPPNDFYLDERLPYIQSAKDPFGRNHYEETNSIGPKTANYIADGLIRLLKKAN